MTRTPQQKPPERGILLVAGGTGGHLFPASALAEALACRGVVVDLVTDPRTSKYHHMFRARAFYTVPSATPSGKALDAKIEAALVMARGVWMARRLIKQIRPLCVVGFGGYPTIPPLLAASFMGVPTLVHEQNAVIGRANRFLSSRVTRIATGFADVAGISSAIQARAVWTGNPVRPEVIAASTRPWPEVEDGILRILVTGGSQGAGVMSDIVPASVSLLSVEQRARLRIVHQARGEDAVRAREIFRKLGVDALVSPFFEDLPVRMADAHLVIARSGAMTVTELALIGRACVLVPFPNALDQDQAANAAILADCGAAEVIRQINFTPERLADTLLAALSDTESLRERGAAAHQLAQPDAAQQLADLVMDNVASRNRA